MISKVKRPLAEWSKVMRDLSPFHAGRHRLESDAIVARLDGLAAQLDRIERRLDVMEHFSHGARATFVGGNRVLVKCVVAERQIAYLVEADDRLLSPWFIVSGGYETELTNYFVRHLRPDSHCLDVGSNFGYFTCLMARFCPQGRIVGVEADQHVYELARDNVFINGFNDRAEALWGAAGVSREEVTLYRRATRSANTSIARLPDDFIRRMGEGESVAFKTPGLRLDDLLPRFSGRIDFMKVDVEGAEPLVFEGAGEIIARNPQLRVIMEWSPGQIVAAGLDVARFVAELQRLGLSAFDIESGPGADNGRPSPLSFEHLLSLPYRPGIVLTRAEAQ